MAAHFFTFRRRRGLTAPSTWRGMPFSTQNTPKTPPFAHMRSTKCFRCPSMAILIFGSITGATPRDANRKKANHHGEAGGRPRGDVSCRWCVRLCARIVIGVWFVPCPRRKRRPRRGLVRIQLTGAGGRMLLGVVAGLPLVGHALGPADDPQRHFSNDQMVGIYGLVAAAPGNCGTDGWARPPPRQPPDRHD